MRLSLILSLISMIVLTPLTVSQSYAQEIVCITEPCEDPAHPTGAVKTPGFFWKLRTWLEDRFETINPNLKEKFGNSEKDAIFTDLNKGLSVAQERIDRVREKLGERAVDKIVEVNELNKIHEEFLEIQKIEDIEERKLKSVEFDDKVNRLPIVIQGCERQINSFDIMDSENYYEKLRTEYCSKSLENIDENQAKEILERSKTCGYNEVYFNGNCISTNPDRDG